MSKRPCTFRQRDLTSAVKAVVKAGYPVARAEIDPSGKIVVVIGQPVILDVELETGNEWDRMQ